MKNVIWDQQMIPAVKEIKRGKIFVLLRSELERGKKSVCATCKNLSTLTRVTHRKSI